MSYQDDEASAEDNRPLEYYVVTYGTTVKYLASGNRDLEIGSQVYLATTLGRSELKISTATGNVELAINLPLDHEIVARYYLQGIPPKSMRLQAFRKQVRSGEVRNIWDGYVTSIACDEWTASLRVPSYTMEVMKKKIPTVTVGRTCPHMLYDTMCGVDRNSYKVTTTAMYVNGRTVRLDIGNPSRIGWAIAGELIHVSSTERMTIGDQVELNPGISSIVDVEMQLLIPGMMSGNSIEVYAGCDHTIETCLTKFNNKDRFGGFPQLPTKNPFDQNGYGVQG